MTAGVPFGYAATAICGVEHMSKPLFIRDERGRLVQQKPDSAAVLCLDVSWSMDERDGADGLRRIDVMASVLAGVLKRIRLQAACTFSTFAHEIRIDGPGPVSLPDPNGTTDMAEAIAFGLRQSTQPQRIVLLSDGEPNDADAAFAQADVCRTRGIALDTYYCGPKGDAAAQAFLQALSARDRKSTRLNSSHLKLSRMPSSA